MRVLVSGFEPFGGSRLNPSFEVLKRLTDDPPPGSTIHTVVLPVVGGRAPTALTAALRRTQPNSVVMLGESGRAHAITIERVAINLRDYRIPDNEGVSVKDQPVVKKGPAAYFATLPVRDLVTASIEAGVPAELSLSAGSFLCNEVMYTALHWAARSSPKTRAGFVHLPLLPEQVLGTPRSSMSIELQLRAVRALLEQLQ